MSKRRESGKQQNPFRGTVSRCALEALEPRLLLTAGPDGSAPLAPFAPGTDLVVEYSHHAAGTYRPSQGMGWWDAVLENTGDTNSGATRVEVRLSLNQVWGDADDVVVLQVDVPAGVTANTAPQQWVAGAPVIPWNTAGGTYYVGAMVDSAGQVAETNESNNVRWSAAADVTVIDIAGAFDSTWYAALYPDIVAAVSSGALTSTYEHFVRWGISENRSPTMFYNQAEYLAYNPDVAAAAAAGQIQPFEHYVQYGQFEGRTASAYLDLPYYWSQVDGVAKPFQHWLQHGRWSTLYKPTPVFDTAFYVSSYGDIASLHNAQTLSGYEHFLRWGMQENRNPNALFSSSFYLGLHTDVAGSSFSAYEHYVRWGRHEPRIVNPLFDESWYLSNYTAAAAAVSAGLSACGFEYYLRTGQAAGHDTSVYYDESYYLSQNLDIAAVVTSGAFRSGFAHFYLYGQKETSRAFSQVFSESQYRTQNPDIVPFIGTAFQSGFEHFMRYGRTEGRWDTLVHTEVTPGFMTDLQGNTLQVEGIRLDIWRRKVTGTTLWQHTFTFTSIDPTSVISAATASSDAYESFYISGPLNQVLAAGVAPTPSLTNVAFLSAGDRAKDTHWLLNDGDVLSLVSMNETSTSLGGTFSINPAQRAPSMDLLQIVVDTGNTVNYKLRIARYSAGFSISSWFTGTL